MERLAACVDGEGLDPGGRRRLLYLLMEALKGQKTAPSSVNTLSFTIPFNIKRLVLVLDLSTMQLVRTHLKIHICLGLRHGRIRTKSRSKIG